MCVLERREKGKDCEWKLRIEWLILVWDNMSKGCKKHEEFELTHVIAKATTKCEGGGKVVGIWNESVECDARQ